MAAGPRLDSAGANKMRTLEDALLLLQRINGIVEQYALAQKRNTPTQAFLQNIRRTLPTLAANLKAQFGMITDQVLALNLAATRGASETTRVRTLREGMAQIKQAIEISMTITKDKHAVEEKSKDEGKPDNDTV
jgi:hypothetical protein